MCVRAPSKYTCCVCASRRPTHRTTLAQDAMRAVVSELRVKHGSIQPLEQKLILWSSSKSELPADGASPSSPSCFVLAPSCCALLFSPLLGLLSPLFRPSILLSGPIPLFCCTLSERASSVLPGTHAYSSSCPLWSSNASVSAARQQHVPSLCSSLPPPVSQLCPCACLDWWAGAPCRSTLPPACSCTKHID